MKTTEKKSPVRQDRDRHECTSWVVLPGATEGRSVMLHKNRDSNVVKLKFYRHSPRGKNAWMALGDAGRVTANMGLNDKGVTIVMNCGDPSDGPARGPEPPLP